MDFANYTNWNDILEKSKKWPPDEQIRFFEWKKQGLTGIVSKNGRWFILESDWQKFLRKEPAFNECEKGR